MVCFRPAIYPILECVRATDAGCPECDQGDYAEKEADVFEVVDFVLFLFFFIGFCFFYYLSL